MKMERDATVLHTELEGRLRVDHKRRERYSKEFRQQAVERMNACDNIARLSREIGVARHLLYHWRDRIGARKRSSWTFPRAHIAQADSCA